MSFFDKAKEAVAKAKGATKAYTDNLKEQEAKNKEMAAAPMEERIKM